MVKKVIFLICMLFILSLNGQAYALTEYYVNTAYGGTWSDAEKSPTNNEDDSMCWAAAASNVLAWSGWTTTGLTDTDAIFKYYQDHWTDQGGWGLSAWKWWFNGVNDKEGVSGWSQVDVSGGNFYNGVSLSDYFYTYSDFQDSSTPKNTMQFIETLLTQGYGVNIGIDDFLGSAHAITVWGYAYDEHGYLGLMVTDSDDGKSSDTPPDQMTYVPVESYGNYWRLKNYYSRNWYIVDVAGLKQKPIDKVTYSSNAYNPLVFFEPVATPEPSAITLLLFGLAGLAGFRKKLRD